MIQFVHTCVYMTGRQEPVRSSNSRESVFFPYYSTKSRKSILQKGFRLVEQLFCPSNHPIL